MRITCGAGWWMRRGVTRGESGEWTLRRECEGERKPSCFCGDRKTKEAGERGFEALKRTRMRKYGDKEPSETRRAYNRRVTAAED
jgi:hypothetical protein